MNMDGKVRIFMIAFADEEWEEIYRHVPRDNLTILINLYQNPAQILPNSGSGRNIPTKFYMSFLGEAFDH